MQSTSTPHYHDKPSAFDTPPHATVAPLRLHRLGRRLVTHLVRQALLATALAAPLVAQAALPEAIQTALSRADLSAADISIVITPVGDKNASHLPAPIKVIDSQHPAEHPNNAASYQSALVTIEKRTIQKHERQLHAYTDDPSTYQSLESIPTLPSEAKWPNAKMQTSQDSSTDDSSVNDGAGVEQKSTAHTTTKISFSPLLSHQAQVARTPASTMKLVPSFIALDTLGADFVWHTRVYHTGVIIGERLYGDLVLQGSGDPKMTHERLQQLLYHVQASGIRHIDGDIIVDSAVFDKVGKDPAAFDNAPLRPYNASPDGFLVNFSTVGIKSYPLDTDRARLTYTPQLADYQLPTTIATRSASCGQARYSLAPVWQASQLVFHQNLPNSCQEHAFYVAYPDAKDFAARVIKAKWQALGNTLTGDVLSRETPYNASSHKQPKTGLRALPMSPLPQVSYPSLNLAQQIHDINHFSNNVMTEQVALSIAAYAPPSDTKTTAADTATPTQTAVSKPKGQEKAGGNKTSLYQFGKPATTNYPVALQTINQWWQHHLDTPAPYLTNGSGLCRDCTITAANLNELLIYAYDHPSFDAYVNSLGIAGVSGTISAHSDRLPESAAIGRAWIKTGTLNNVTSMAGYVKGLSGQDYVVVGIINSEQTLNAYTARPVLDAMLDWTAQH
ncbi:D-alanyl-D-alanine carboxypeptidase/D-alanyl-D-alanine-endopeptidase [Psychrobacter celer]|uniref:D-alanyl-D-alanine carboxypeptidase/D-alanyl-D-alanine-endopeptidase n=1 Tax=Psychrobacter celer TaxID=306572 RepID=UPI002FE4750A